METQVPSSVLASTTTSPSEYHDFAYDRDFDSRPQIRLLSFIPVRGGGRIFLDLVTFSLASAPPFTALSYMWGERAGGEHAVINGRSLYIRRNCAYALRQLRSAVASTKYYWIDAISIDQSNVQERGHQVQMMARIFERAQQVAISYGIEDFETTSFTHMLLQLDALPSLHNNQPVRKGGKLTPEASAGLLHLIQSPYWSRMWIVQELAVAKSVVILTKDTTLPLPFVFRFAHTVRLDRWLRQATAFNDDNAWSSLSVTDFDKLPMMTLGYSLNWQGSDMLRGAAPFARRPLHDTLDYYGDKLCEDVRDRIYAVISLVDWPQDLVQLTVDYNTTALQLALRVCMYDKTHSPHLPGPWQCASLLCDCLGITLEDKVMAVMMEERRQRLGTILRAWHSGYPECNPRLVAVASQPGQQCCGR